MIHVQISQKIIIIIDHRLETLRESSGIDCYECKLFIMYNNRGEFIINDIDYIGSQYYSNVALNGKKYQ